MGIGPTDGVSAFALEPAVGLPGFAVAFGSAIPREACLDREETIGAAVGEAEPPPRGMHSETEVACASARG
jgi:hypothetical protein